MISSKWKTKFILVDSIWIFCQKRKKICHKACLMGEHIVLVFENRSELKLRLMRKSELGCVVKYSMFTTRTRECAVIGFSMN